MAGSLNHIVSEDGRYYLDHIENMRDANEALEECFSLIFYLAKGDRLVVSNACRALGFPDPWEDSREGDTFVALAKPYYDERAATVLAAPGGEWDGPNYTHPPADAAIERAEADKPKPSTGGEGFAEFIRIDLDVAEARAARLLLSPDRVTFMVSRGNTGEDPEFIIQGVALTVADALDAVLSDLNGMNEIRDEDATATGDAEAPDFSEVEPGIVTLDDLDSVVPKGSVADIANMLTGRALTESAAAYLAVYVVGLER